MYTEAITQEVTDFVSDVRYLIHGRLETVASNVGIKGNTAQLLPGKMLRTRFAAHLVCSGHVPSDSRSVELACAATEMAHTASLIHDDLIDGGYMRRNLPTLWKSKGASGAVLVGDCLVCEAMDILFDIEDGRYARSFVMKLQEVCATEAEQELLLRGKCLDEATCLRISRGKTGPFFAFLGHVCGGDDADLCSALQEAGYRIGTAYQIGDDLLDIVGVDDVAGKTLGTDLGRGKFTFPREWEITLDVVFERISDLKQSALDCLDSWPQIRETVADFFAVDLTPVLDRRAEDSTLSVGLAV